MIDLSVYIHPYSVKNECGDFYLYTELEDYHLLAVGDIGGHGSYKVFQIANEIKEYINNHKENNIQDLMKKVHQYPALKNVGMTMFLAQVYKNLPIVNYCAVGNTKSFIYRDKNILNLVSQEGVIGYDIPSDIKVNMYKILNNDLLIVTTDGVSFHGNENIASRIEKTKEINTLTKFFATQSNNDADDALCVALRFTKFKTKDFSIKYSNNKIVEDIKKDKNIPKKTIETIRNNTQNSIVKHENRAILLKPKQEKKKKLLKFKNDELLCENLKKDSINLAINKIIQYSGLDKRTEVKTKTFLHEAIISSNVDIYIKDNILQLYIEDVSPVKNSLEFLFDQYYIFDDNDSIVNITLEKKIKLSTEDFGNLRKMIKLNLSDKDFQLYIERENFLSNMAYKDNLTQIYNRNKFNYLLNAELIRDNRYHREFSIAIVDIDHFKKFNDTYGHLIGDEVLILLANCLKENVRKSDIYARWGGEEFVLLFPETNVKGAFSAAEQLRIAIEKLSHETAGSITASFGITQYIEGEIIDTMFKRCDDALYEAKEMGRNRVCIK